MNFSNANSILPDVQIKFLDKIIHFGAYLLLSVLWSSYVITLKSNYLLLSFVTTLLFAIALEFFQETINPMRTYESLDMLANCIGVVIGTIIVIFFKKHTLKSQ